MAGIKPFWAPRLVLKTTLEQIHRMLNRRPSGQEQYANNASNGGGEMTRQSNTTCTGVPFPREIILAVWEKAENDPGFKTFKIDCCGITIQKNKYGTTSAYGWEIDHIQPVEKGGTDDLENLQPLYWENNRSKGDQWPQWECATQG